MWAQAAWMEVAGVAEEDSLRSVRRGIGVVARSGSAALARGLNQGARAYSVEGGEMLERVLAAREVRVRKRWIG